MFLAVSHQPFRLRLTQPQQDLLVNPFLRVHNLDKQISTL